jgi:hypothetical protein
MPVSHSDSETAAAVGERRLEHQTDQAFGKSVAVCQTSVGLRPQERLTDTMKRLPPRYQRLATEVSQRLPPGWMLGGPADHSSDIDWEIELTEDVHLTQSGCVVVASAAAERFETIECWTVTLHRRVLDHLSDQAVRWVIARELGYVAACRASGSGISPESDDSGPGPVRAACDRRADVYAIDWGFADEKKAYDQEVSLL